MTDLAALRHRLAAFRDDILRLLAADDVLDGGLLALAADAVTVLAALDAMAAAPDSAELGDKGGCGD